MQFVSCFLQLLMQHHDDISNYLESFMSSLSCSRSCSALHVLVLSHDAETFNLTGPVLTHWSCPCSVAALWAVRPWFLFLVGLSSHCTDHRSLHKPPQRLVTCFHSLPAHMKLQNHRPLSLPNLTNPPTHAFCMCANNLTIVYSDWSCHLLLQSRTSSNFLHLVKSKNCTE